MSSSLINTQLIAERRVALNMSERALIQATGVSHRLVYSLDAQPGGDQSVALGASVTLAELARLAKALAVTPAELLQTEDALPAGPPADDIAVLLAALMDGAQVTLTRQDDLAHALGWPLERVESAACQAAGHLPTLGLTLHRTNALGLGVRARHAVLTTEDQQRLARAKTVRTNVRLDEARVLRDVAHAKFAKDWRRSLRSNQRVCIQALFKRGLIEDSSDGLALTPTARYSLLLCDEAPAEDSSPPDTGPGWPFGLHTAVHDHPPGRSSQVTRRAAALNGAKRLPAQRGVHNR